MFPSGKPATQISGPVHPRIRIIDKRIFQEALRRQLQDGSNNHAPPGTANVQFTRHPHGHRLSVHIEM